MTKSEKAYQILDAIKTTRSDIKAIINVANSLKLTGDEFGLLASVKWAAAKAIIQRLVDCPKLRYEDFPDYNDATGESKMFNQLNDIVCC